MILGELHKNTKKKDKASAQLALGEKIRNAGDDASGLAISEKMRVRIRALGQDEANVKNGASMLRTAEGAIQSQINLLRTIKEKVIDAHNDTNTDTDRMIIQKEISQYYDEINDIAAETTFNKKLLLLGNTVQETVKSWVVMDHAELVEGSDELDLIPNNFATLDKDDKGNPLEGPFDTFGSASDYPAYDGYSVKSINANNVPGYDSVGETTDSYSKLHGGTENDPNTFEIDLSGYNEAGLNNTAFTVKYLYNITNKYTLSKTYVLTDNSTGNAYKNVSDSDEINISGKSKADIASAIAAEINGDLSAYFTASASGEKVTLTTKYTGELTNIKDKNGNPKSSYNVYYNVTGTKINSVTKADATGLGNYKLQGGEDRPYHLEYDPATDRKDKRVYDGPGAYATATRDISAVTADTGITINAGSDYYLVFKDNASKVQPDDEKGYFTVGKNYTGDYTFGGVKAHFENGKMTLTATSVGDYYNSYGVTDGVPSFTAASALTGMKSNEVGKDGDIAYWKWNLSDYNVSDEAKANEFIEKLVGKAFSRSYNSTSYEFIDSSKSPAIESISKLYSNSSSYIIDLNNLRNSVKSGKTVSEAFSDIIVSKLGTNYAEQVKESDQVVGVKILANVPGTYGNDQYIVFKEGHLRDYTIDFTSAFSSKGIADGGIASALDGKGLRFYCATDSAQWVNVQFVNGVNPVDDDRPQSGTEGLDIKTFVVDVSDVTDVKSLVKTIYEGDGNKNPQGLEDWLTNVYKHFFHLAADYEKGTITIYDNRRETLLNNSYYSDKQSKGAKIADGVLDNVKQDVRYVYVHDLVIHHTDRSSANIHVRIPQTTMDHIFGYKVGTYSLDDYSVMTSEKREKLLGTDGPPKVEGTLDKGLQYLIDANTLIGAQIVHMEHAEANIITDQESTTSAESVIRDADMAKSSLELATAQILAQSGQTMLSQSNQNSSNVLSLLQ